MRKAPTDSHSLSAAIAGAATRLARKSPARVLVASNRLADLRQIVEQLQEDHDHVSGSINAEAATEDFKRLLPHVIVVAFEGLQESDRYLLTLYRNTELASIHSHRTVLLCAQAEVRLAYELCKKGCYDDYVLHWPMAQDGLRLSMCVWNAAQAAIEEAARPSGAKFAPHAEELVEVKSLLDQEISEGQRLSSTVAGALAQVQDAVEAAIDGFSHRVTAPGRKGASVVNDAAQFTRQVKRLKAEGVRRAFLDGSRSLPRTSAWPKQAMQRLEELAAHMRDLARTSEQPRGLLMVVEDEEVQQELIAAALDGSGFELLILPDGASLIGAIRRRKPDMILMDINLPGIDGVNLTRMIKDLPRLAGVPILMLTGEASRESIAVSIQAGAVGYIVKPFTRQTVLKSVERFLPRRRAAAANH